MFRNGQASSRWNSASVALCLDRPVTRRELTRRAGEAAIRFAIYYAPAPDDPLTEAAAAWLGRDAFGREPGTAPLVPGFSRDAMEARTADARRYGFHATLKAPFRLAEPRTPSELAAALNRFASDRPAVTIPSLALADLDGFFALVPAVPSPALQALAASVVEGFEPFRAPLTPEEFAKRRPDRLDARQRDYLERFGYPHIFEEFQFHMTLTDRLAAEERPSMRTALENHFPATLLSPVAIDRLALFREAVPGAPFTVEASFPLKGAAATSA